MNAKQVIVMRKDLGMTKGKMVAQGAHASLGVILSMMVSQKRANGVEMSLEVVKDSPLDEWINGIFTKVCVYVDSEEELLRIFEEAAAANLPVKLIEDRGLTMFHGVPTKTCLAIGPAESERIDPITGHLKLL